MTAINLQIQPARCPELDVSAAVAYLCDLDPSARVSKGEDAGKYINLDFTPVDAVALWQEIRSGLNKDPFLAAAAIVVCEGEHGWDDYLLLHHFDRTVQLDQLK